jgi:hypothetical protein
MGGFDRIASIRDSLDFVMDAMRGCSSRKSLSHKWDQLSCERKRSSYLSSVPRCRNSRRRGDVLARSEGAPGRR